MLQEGNLQAFFDFTFVKLRNYDGLTRLSTVRVWPMRLILHTEDKYDTR